MLVFLPPGLQCAFIKLETKKTKAGGESESLAVTGGDLHVCTGISYQP